MRSVRALSVSFVLAVGLILSRSQSSSAFAAVRTAPQRDSVAAAVYEGRTPCHQVATQFTGFPSERCEKVKWEVTLYRDRGTNAPSAFVYRGTRTRRSGRWTIHRGSAADPNAVVYRLTPTSGEPLSLMSVEGNVLLLLDAQSRVLVGDASWSYALNRTDKNLKR